ncbi:hypothetical protein FACS189442_6140 [Spirochaetia bacterium]|nr:hypothetical protein FACS189442_6140 [Spirochaetia bacterium]
MGFIDNLKQELNEFTTADKIDADVVSNKKMVLELFETLYTHINEYYNLLQKYDGDIVDLLPPHSTNESVNIINEDDTETLKELNTCIIRITNDIINLGKVLNRQYTYPLDEITKSNNKLVQLSGRCYGANGEFHSVDNPSELLTKIHNDFLTQIETLNGLIVKYNKNKENKLYGIQEALEIWQNRNTGFN